MEDLLTQPNETGRLSALYQLNILDTLPEKEFDDIVELAAELCDVPVCLFSLVDENRQWFKSCIGLSVNETSREISFCSHAILRPEEAMIIPDAREDDRFKNNPLVVDSPHLVFYAGFPVVYQGNALGTLCLIDHQPRTLTPLQVKAMKTLANNISQQILLRHEKQFISKENRLFTKALSLNSSYYLLIEPDMTLKEIGLNFLKSVPDIEKGRSFYDYFQWYSKFDLDAFLKSDQEDYSKLLLIESHKNSQRYKCSLSKVDQHLIICASPVINAQYKIDNYFLNTKDFAFHDSILEFLFLQETTQRNIAEAKAINQKITNKSSELEKLIQQLQLKERELILSNIRIEEQRQFYGEILNNFPTDIAVFSTDHRYLYVNSRGIKDKETRDFMIGRTDYDYCDLRKIDYSIADKRREQFNKVLATGKAVEWEDAYLQADGTSKYILRRFAPVHNPSGELMNVIGYGIEITELKQYQLKIEAQNESIQNINDNLERIVQEKTEKNNELTQLLTHQDKLAMVGEITAGITHDLNTPLGAIKVGSESLQYSLENLFNQVLEPCSIEQLHYACNRARVITNNLFIGGMQTKTETSEMLQYLTENYPDIKTEHKILADSFVKARILTNEQDEIRQVIQHENRIAFLELIYTIKAIKFFTETILQASDRASGVIKNLRFYLKEGSSTEMKKVNLSESIQTVLSIFSHELKKGIDLQINVPDHIFLFGYEAKIYQVWSNIIKNAIDAMKSKGIIQIKAQDTPFNTTISISNNGPQIPERIRDRIFDKFFTTKDDTSGTGLGLNIVKQVMDEHRGQVAVESDENITRFIFTFPKEISL